MSLMKKLNKGVDATMAFLLISIMGIGTVGVVIYAFIQYISLFV